MASAVSSAAEVEDMVVLTQWDMGLATASTSEFNGGIVHHMIQCSADRVIVDDAGTRPLGVVQVGQPVAQSRTQMKQRGGWLFRHTVVAVSSTCHHPLKETQDAAHAGRAIQGGDKMHFRCTPGWQNRHPHTPSSRVWTMDSEPFIAILLTAV